MSRGILYMVWGEKVEQALQRSIASVREIHPELPVKVIRLPPGTDSAKGAAFRRCLLDLRVPLALGPALSRPAEG